MFNRREILKSLAAMPIVGLIVPKKFIKPKTLGELAKENTVRLGPARITELKREHNKYKKRRKTPAYFMFHKKSGKWIGTIFWKPKDY